MQINLGTAWPDLATIEAHKMPPRVADPFTMLVEAMRQRPEAFPRRLLTGRNWPTGRSGYWLHFDLGALPRSFPIEENDPDCDSIVEWEDGFLSVMRTDREQAYGNSPVQFGKARRGIAGNGSGSARQASTTGNAGKRNKRKGR